MEYFKTELLKKRIAYYYSCIERLKRYSYSVETQLSLQHLYTLVLKLEQNLIRSLEKSINKTDEKLTKKINP